MQHDPLLEHTSPSSAWTTVNISEALPGLFRPLSWTAVAAPCERGLRRGFHDLGALTAAEIEVPRDVERRMIAIFYGRCAASVDTLRLISDRTPGTSGDAFEKQIFGAARPDQPNHRILRRYPLALAKTVHSAVVLGRRLHRQGREVHRWWQALCIEELDERAAETLFIEAGQRLEAAFRPHMTARMIGQGLFDRIQKLAEAAEVDPLDVAGGGRLEETMLVGLLLEVATGERSIDQFLAEYGFHGPAEGDLASHTWREDPKPLHGWLDSLRRRTPGEALADVLVGRARRRERARHLLRAALPAHRRAAAALLLRAADHYVVLGEQGKAMFLKALDGLRFACRRRGAEMVMAGVLADPEDVFLLTADEAFAPTLTATEATRLCDERRRRHLEYESLELPQSWIGPPTPINREVRPAEPDAPASDQPATAIRGMGGAPGSVTGTARVVLDPAEVELDEGDILVCEMTDPSWAPHIYLAAALVIDVGSAMSHGAIVARELGVPCVIGTRDGTRRIDTGDLLHVDGSAGTVTVLPTQQRSSAHAAEEH